MHDGSHILGGKYSRIYYIRISNISISGSSVGQGRKIKGTALVILDPITEVIIEKNSFYIIKFMFHTIKKCIHVCLIINLISRLDNTVTNNN